MDVGQLMPAAEFYERIGTMSAEIKRAEMAEGVQIFLPGEMEWDKREKALAEGMELPEDVLISLRGLAEDSDLDPAEYHIDLSS